MLVVAERIQVKPERRAEALAAALKMAQTSQAEPGCRSYRLYADFEDANTFFIFEEWDSADALSAHFATPHMKEFAGLVPQVIAGAPSIKRYDVRAEKAL